MGDHTDPDSGQGAHTARSATLLADRTFQADSVTENGAPRSIVPGTTIRVRFAAGSIGANAGCNSLTAPVRIQPDRLVVGQIITTLIGCGAEREEQDRWLAGFLAADPNWSLTAGRLMLASGSTVIVLTETGPEDAAVTT
jgi:heat shock protein HslJ